MSFQIHVGLIGVSDDGARAVAVSVAGTTPLEAVYDKRVHLLGNPTVAISEIPGVTSANELLDDGADWNAGYWLLRPEILADLARTVALLFEQTPQGIVFCAAWISDRPGEVVEVDLPDLVKSILSNRTPNRTLAIVRKR